MLKISYLILCCFVSSSFQKSTPEDSSYVAAVLEYAYTNNSTINLQNYINYIEDAANQNADIVVFPEATLTRSNSLSVPFRGLLQRYPIPALQPTLYDEILVALSEASRQHSIYVVMNIQEIMDCTANDQNEFCPEQKIYYFNTNVVLDRSGAVIDRYRKINLFGEFSRTPALQPDLGIFETDFGVKFGHFICFDLMFQVPAVQVVEKLNLTDVVFTTMWFSEMPYLTAVQIQEAYAYTMNVNFLASGANSVTVGSAGSGIYSGKVGALISTMPGKPTTRLLVSRVPKVPGQVTEPYPGPIYDAPSDHDQLKLKTDPSLLSHVSKLLVDGLQEFVLEDYDVRCHFRVKLNHAKGENVYKYRAAAFDGVRTFDNLASGGNRVCTVVACVGENMADCGTRFPEYSIGKTAVFEELVISAEVPTPNMNISLLAHDSIFYPVSLDSSIMPLESEDYIYSVVSTGTSTNYKLELVNKNKELYNFAVWGRVFNTDGEEPTAASSSRFVLFNVLIVPSVLIVITCLFGRSFTLI